MGLDGKRVDRPLAHSYRYAHRLDGWLFQRWRFQRHQKVIVEWGHEQPEVTGLKGRSDEVVRDELRLGRRLTSYANHVADSAQGGDVSQRHDAPKVLLTGKSNDSTLCS